VVTPANHASSATAIGLYVGTVIGFGAALLIALGPRQLPPVALVLTLLAAMLVVSVFKLRLPFGQSTMSMAFAVDFVSLLTAGADVAMVVAAAGVLVQCCVRVRSAQPWYRTAFSVATAVISVQAAGLIWTALGGTLAGPTVISAIVPLAAAALVYFGINGGLISAAIALTAGMSPAAWWQTFVATAPGYLVAAAAAGAFVVSMQHQAYLLVALAVAPVAVCYAAYAVLFRRMAERLQEETVSPGTVSV
jgi:hypothetical protein